MNIKIDESAQNSTMEWDQWLAELQSLLGELKNLQLPYSLGTNEITNPAEEFDELPHTIDGKPLPIVFLDFYSRCDGIAMNAVRNGYWIFGFKDAITRHQLGEVNRVENGENPVLIFGGDGGGGRFSLGLKEGQISYLPSGGLVQDASWLSTHGFYAPRLLAENFTGFLGLLFADVRAFIHKNPDWKYIDSR